MVNNTVNREKANVLEKTYNHTKVEMLFLYFIIIIIYSC